MGNTTHPDLEKCHKLQGTTNLTPCPLLSSPLDSTNMIVPSKFTIHLAHHDGMEGYRGEIIRKSRYCSGFHYGYGLSTEPLKPQPTTKKTSRPADQYLPASVRLDSIPKYERVQAQARPGVRRHPGTAAHTPSSRQDMSDVQDASLGDPWLGVFVPCAQSIFVSAGKIRLSFEKNSIGARLLFEGEGGCLLRW